jgi:deoxyribodipyrimidine photo-lyase
MRTSLFWYTKDLRLSDLPALVEASTHSEVVIPVYIWDDEHLEDEADNKNAFLLDCLLELDRSLRERGSGLHVMRGATVSSLIKLSREHNCSDVYCTASRDPATKQLQESARSALRQEGITLHSSHANFLLDPDEISTKSGGPYRVFTPFRNAAVSRLSARKKASTPKNLIQAVKVLELPAVALQDISQDRQRGGSIEAHEQWKRFKRTGLASYNTSRDELANDAGTSKLSAYLNFGTISIDELVRDLLSMDDPEVEEGKKSFLNELLWREFNAYIVHHFPNVLHRAFREELTFIDWKGKAEHLEAWKQGRTGYPIVDAAMRQLLQTGWMHNRARMIVASFLVKDLLINWQEGEAHFMQWLTDGDEIQNNAGWQWSASTGVDAQPYFRIFNPITQGKRFDPLGEYVRRYVPELRSRSTKAIHDVNVVDGLQYPRAIVDHSTQRERALVMFKKAMTNLRK